MKFMSIEEPSAINVLCRRIEVLENKVAENHNSLFPIREKLDALLKTLGYEYSYVPSAMVLRKLKKKKGKKDESWKTVFAETGE